MRKKLIALGLALVLLTGLLPAALALTPVSEDVYKRQVLDCSDDEEAVTALMSFCGIGRKVADCILLFGLHRLDAFPSDTHIKQILAERYPAGFPYDRYRGFLGVIQQYLFYYHLRQ